MCLFNFLLQELCLLMHFCTDIYAGTFYSGNRAGSKRDGREGLTNDDSEGSSCLSCTSSSAQKMSIRALKLLHWILRFRHHVEFVQDPLHELLGLLRLIRRDTPLGLPHYVLKVTSSLSKLGSNSEASVNFSNFI